jgi:hypothetical protein
LDQEFTDILEDNAKEHGLEFIGGETVQSLNGDEQGNGLIVMTPFLPKSILPSNQSVSGCTPTANSTVSASYSFLSVITLVTLPCKEHGLEFIGGETVQSLNGDEQGNVTKVITDKNEYFATNKF